MSWNNTVRCSYCYNKGHNKAGCPELKEFIKKNPDSYQAHQAQHRANSAKTRKCTYCETQGHNRKTCADIKDHTKRLTVVTQKLREGVLNYMVAQGIGVGALVNAHHDEGLALVQGIAWDQIVPGNFRNYTDGPSQWHTSFIHTRPLKHMSDPNWASTRALSRIAVKSAVDTSEIAPSLSGSWHRGEDSEAQKSIKEFVKERQAYDIKNWTLDPLEDHFKKSDDD